MITKSQTKNIALPTILWYRKTDRIRDYEVTETIWDYDVWTDKLSMTSRKQDTRSWPHGQTGCRSMTSRHEEDNIMTSRTNTIRDHDATHRQDRELWRHRQTRCRIMTSRNEQTRYGVMTSRTDRIREYDTNNRQDRKLRRHGLTG